ncbi:MAG: dienelactone hydrolase family protein [Rhodospirillales bacterium]|nr:dienelactone hydrolase family protein [Rhodospirillales bacterium]
MAGEMILISSHDGGEFQAYQPARADKFKGQRGPGVIIIQEVFGVTPWVKAISDHFAAHGYQVLAPDMFWRIEPNFSATFDDEEGVAKARGFLPLIDHDLAVQDIGSSADALRAMDGCNGKIAVAGFCLGGTLAYLSAARLNIDAAAVYYGTQVHEYLTEGGKIKCPTVFHMADHDDFIDDADVKEIFSALIGIPNIAIWTYDTGHGFTNWDRPGAYNKGLADKAHERTFATFDRLS